MNKNQGFTLIELVVVIVILGILAATAMPKFINLTDSALQAKVEANAGALRSGVNLANLKWRVAGSPQDFAGRDNIQLYGSAVTGQIDINTQGFLHKATQVVMWLLQPITMMIVYHYGRL